MAYLIDGTIDVSGGQNSGRTPDRIEKNQVHKAVNVSFSNGSINPRPRFTHTPVVVITEGTEAGTSYQTIFDTGKFQGEREFLAGTRSYAISVRGGIIFKVDYDRGTATVLRTTADDRISQLHRRVAIEPAGKYIVIWDWPNQPIYVDDDVARRTNYYAKDERGLTLPEIPQSRLGVFVQSRLWIANTREFTAGDFVGDAAKPRAPLTFGEVLTPGAPYVGQAFNLGYGFNNLQITAMGYISSRNAQSKVQATKYGPLYVATRRSVHLYDAELPRAEWLQTNFGRLELWGTGIVGHRAHSIIGSDVIFQSAKGNIHSFTKNQNDARSGWATTVISKEVEDWLATVNEDFLDIGFITYFDNTVFIGARPTRIPIKGYRGQGIYDYAHEGLVALEISNGSLSSDPSNPRWAGLWTGLRPMEAVQVHDDLYIISKDVDGYNRTYRLDKSAIYDSWNYARRSLRGRVYTRSYDHEKPFTEKIEHSVDVNIGAIRGDLRLKVLRKPLHVEKFVEWNTYIHKETCNTDCIETVAPIAPVGHKILSFGSPVDPGCNPATGEPYSHYRESQLLLEFECGDFRIDKVKLKAEEVPESDNDGTPCTAEVREQPTVDCDLVSDWDLYSICPKPGDT